MNLDKDRMIGVFLVVLSLGFIGYLITMSMPSIWIGIFKNTEQAHIESVTEKKDGVYELSYRIDTESGSKFYKREISQKDYLKIDDRSQLEVFYTNNFPSYVVIKEFEKPHPISLVVIVLILSVMAVITFIRIALGKKTIDEVFGASRYRKTPKDVLSL